MRRSDGTEISIEDAATLIAVTIANEGATGVLGQAEVARLTRLSQRLVGILMPRATAIAAALFPGRTLRLRETDTRVFQYGVTDAVGADWFKVSRTRNRKAITAVQRFADEMRNLPDPRAQAASAEAEAAIVMLKAANAQVVSLTETI